MYIYIYIYSYNYFQLLSDFPVITQTYLRCFGEKVSERMVQKIYLNLIVFNAFLSESLNLI